MQKNKIKIILKKCKKFLNLKRLKNSQILTNNNKNFNNSVLSWKNNKINN